MLKIIKVQLEYEGEWASKYLYWKKTTLIYDFFSQIIKFNSSFYGSWTDQKEKFTLQIKSQTGKKLE